MLVAYFILLYEMIKAKERTGYKHVLRAQDRFRARLSRAWRWSEEEVRDASETSPVWCAHKDILRTTE